MELFAVSVGNTRISPESLLARLEIAIRRLHISRLQANWTCAHNGGFARIACHAELTQAQYLAQKGRVCRAAADTVADVIINDLERLMILQIISKAGSVAGAGTEDINKIESFCRSVMDGQDAEKAEAKGRSHRKGKIAGEISAWLESHGELNLEGFVRFRLRAYKEELREVAEYAIDEYLMEKQYQEFIALLKYFVLIQDAKIPAAHLMHRGDNDFILLNEQMERIESKQITGFVLELADKDINYEDMIVSTLISVAPKQIYIHTREPEKQVIKTIQQIFENRTCLCTYCPSCKPVLGKKRKNQSCP